MLEHKGFLSKLARMRGGREYRSDDLVHRSRIRSSVASPPATLRIATTLYRITVAQPRRWGFWAAISASINTSAAPGSPAARPARAMRVSGRGMGFLI